LVTPRQTFRVHETIWKEFQKKCAAKGYSASEVLRAFIMAVVKGQFNIETLKPTKASKGQSLSSDDLILQWLQQRQNN